MSYDFTLWENIEIIFTIYKLTFIVVNSMKKWSIKDQNDNK